MRSPVLLALVIALVCTTAHAAIDSPRLRLLDASTGQLDPVRHAKTDLFLLGLGLTLGGLVLGGAGFAILAVCQEGASCYSQTTTIIGWCLAAPGILPLAAGLIILYLFTGNRRSLADATDLKPRWALAAVPLRGGGLVGASISF